MSTYSSIVVVLMLLGAILIMKHFYPSYKDDNVVEEKIEKVIHLKTGLDMDLTPTSKEK